jgi:hypothetical protein
MDDLYYLFTTSPIGPFPLKEIQIAPIKLYLNWDENELNNIKHFFFYYFTKQFSQNSAYEWEIYLEKLVRATKEGARGNGKIQPSSILITN